MRRLILVFFLFWLAPAMAAEAPLVNRLAGHPSPYLALHGTDPVAWQEWNADTLARARRENKPLLLSLGYFACHWCHVMQQESFRDPAIAALLNRDFIPVKIDRELNQGLDADLIEFSRRLLGASGWPLNVFVTPEGYPFYAVLYQPADRFRLIVDRLAQHWRADSGGVEAAARAAAPPHSAAAHPLAADADDLAALRQRLREAALDAADPLQGGFGSVSKFPETPRLQALLELQARTPDARLGEFLRLTLDNMAHLGLHDPVNGGFFRYTTDPDWHTPHFEKMLYDNAQLAVLYARAASVFGQPAYRDIAHATLDFLLEVLAAPAGGFRASVSALDRRGREGGAYLWRPEELRKRLSPEQYRLIHRIWGLGVASAFDLGHLPMERRPPAAAERALLDAAHARLKAAGRMREVPLDDKLNAGLNGLALSAFSLAGRGVPRFEAAATRLRDFIATALVRDGRLLKSRVGKKDVFEGAELDDYAHVARGLLDHAAAFDDADSRALARQLAQRAWTLFHSDAGWRREDRRLLATAAILAALPDEATPSASATLIGVSLELPGAAPSATIAHALAHATRSALADPMRHPGSLALLRARFAPAP